MAALMSFKRTPEIIIKQLGTLKGERGTWDQHWQEITDLELPRKNNITQKLAPGVKRNAQVFDNTGPQSGELLAGALHGMLTNPATRWFELTTGDKQLDQDDEVRKWLQDTEWRMLNALNQTNFQTEVHELYIDLVFLGTAGQTVLEDDENDFRFNTYHISEIFFKENNKGIIDEVYRCFSWPASVIIQEFGQDNVPEKIVKDARDQDGVYEIIHCTYPNRGYEKEIKFKIISKYVLVETQTFLRVGGFNEQLWMCPRWSKASGEVYGRGPGMTALPEVKTINIMTEAMIRGAQKTIDPPMQAPDDGFVMPIRTKPGSINYYRAGSGKTDKIQPIFNDMRIDFGFQILDSHRMRIREAFFVDQLQLANGPQMTATEVNQRTDEKMRFLGPMLGRMQAEYLRPMIDRVFGIMLRKKRFLAVPAALKGKSLDVTYSSQIAKMQRMAETDSIMRTMQMIQPFIAIDAGVVDIFDTDAAAKGVAKQNSFPQEYIRDSDAIKTIRDARQKALADQQKAQMQLHQAQLIGTAGPGAAQAAKAGLIGAPGSDSPGGENG